MEEMEKEIADLRDEINRLADNHCVPPNKSLVTKKSIYEMIIFEE
jgi:MerR family transcriptional regulator/heat shock protein HspR